MTKRLTRQPAWLLIALLAGNALAQETPAQDAPAERPAYTPADTVSADATGTATLGFALLPARFRHRAASPAPADNTGAREPVPGLKQMDYRDRAPLITRLKELDGLRLLTFWETRAFAVFFGVSRDGIAGLNISQKKDDAPEREEEEASPADPAPEPTYLAASIHRR